MSELDPEVYECEVSVSERVKLMRGVIFKWGVFVCIL